MRYIDSAIFAFSSLVCFGLLGCCHNKGEEHKAVAIGISSGMDRKMTKSSPLYTYLLTNNIGYKEETQQFLDRIKKHHQALQLQSWALTVLNNHVNDKKPFNLSREEIPDFILQLDPPLEPFVIVHPNSYVTIAWGGGFGFWGLFLAGSNSEPPANPAIYVVNWAPGVQTFHDLQ